MLEPAINKQLYIQKAVLDYLPQYQFKEWNIIKREYTQSLLSMQYSLLTKLTIINEVKSDIIFLKHDRYCAYQYP